MRHENLSETINIPQGCTFNVVDGLMVVKGSKGELSRVLPDKKIKIDVQEDKINVSYDNATKREKRMLFTTRAHINNLFKGVMEGFTYKLKICSGHFPMNVALKGDTLEIKNFIGEKVPRTLKIKTGASVKVNGSDIVVEGLDKEIAGQTAGSIEKLTKRPGFDKRIFQDGIYIVEKNGKKLS